MKKMQLPFGDDLGVKYVCKIETGPYPSKLILVIDTETTGFTPDEAEIIEIAGVMVKVNTKTNEVVYIEPAFTYLREPIRSKISSTITEVTGLTIDDVRGKQPDIDEIYRWLAKADIIACHNTTFDMQFLEDWLEDFPFKPRVCTCNDFPWVKEGFSKKKLTTILEELGYEFPAHRAINDCRATAWAMARRKDLVERLLFVASNDTYKIKVRNTPKGKNKEMNELGFYWNKRAEALVGNFPDMDAVMEARESIKKIYPKKFDQLKLELHTVNPKYRFSVLV